MRLTLIGSLLLIACTALMADDAPGLPFDMPQIAAPVFPDRSFDICTYGAVGDGKTLNSKAFADAIKACADAGGGRVVVPAGKWLTGPIHLKSNVELHLEEGSEILFSNNFEDYLPPVLVRWEGMELYNWSPLIYARECENIAITGEGTLDGQGETWWGLNKTKRQAAAKLYEMVLNGVPPEKRVFGIKELMLRPSFIHPFKCRNVLIEGIKIKSGPMWTVHPVYCEDVLIRNIRVETHGPNTDGLVPDSCKNVIVDGCFFSTGDDCIVIKSGLNEDGWRVGRPTENIVVRNCRMERGHGGVVIGSEMSGGVRNVLVENCTFNGTARGIRLKSRRGRGGLVENIWARNLTMRNLDGEVLRINLHYGAGSVTPSTDVPPAFRNVNLSNITCAGARKAVHIIGLPESPVENVKIEDVNITADSGVSITDARNVKLENVDIKKPQP